jgi:hypothetical protein
MGELRVGRWQIAFDHPATAAAYDRVTDDVAGRCSCAYCRNFWFAAQEPLPLAVRTLFDRLGIDHRKPAEVHEYGPESGLILYGAWWHFVGRVLVDPGDQLALEAPPGQPAAHVFFYQRSDLAHEPLLLAGDLVQLELTLHLPWLLSEPHPQP